MPEKRAIESSLCYKPSSNEYHFHKCATGNSNSPVCFVDNDIKAMSCRLGLTDFSVLIRNVKLVIDDVEKGSLPKTDSRFDSLVKPCVTQPDIWELRWNIWGKHFRMYYSEDGGRIPEFVALSFTEKATEGLSDDEIKDKQNKAIETAQERFTDYEGLQWGHVESGCQYCEWE